MGHLLAEMGSCYTDGLALYHPFTQSLFDDCVGAPGRCWDVNSWPGVRAEQIYKDAGPFTDTH